MPKKSKLKNNRIVVWPRGNFLLSTNFLSSLYCAQQQNNQQRNEYHNIQSLQNLEYPFKHFSHKDAVDIALCFVYDHVYRMQTRIVTYADWLKFARNNALFSDAFAFGVFLVAQNVVPIAEILSGAKLAQDVTLSDEMNADNNDENGQGNGTSNNDNVNGNKDKFALKKNEEIKAEEPQKIEKNRQGVCAADLLALGLTIATLDCDRSAGPEGVANFFRQKIRRISWLAVCCDFEFASTMLCGPKFLTPFISANANNDIFVPLRALANLDLVFEATVLKNDVKSTDCSQVAAIIPLPLSHVLYDKIGIEKLGFARIAAFLERSLQADVFRLDDFSSPSINKPKRTVRSITSTQLAAHRRITVRDWSHMELLTSIVYANANLCIQHGRRGKSSAIFHPRALKSVAILDLNYDDSLTPECRNNNENLITHHREQIGPIVLGPVTDCVLIRRVRGARISVICKQIFVDYCTNVTLFVNTPASVLIGIQCANIRVAPYNVYYDGLAKELSCVGMRLLSASENAWNNSVQIDGIFANELKNTSKCYSILPADEFYVQPTPFHTEFSSEQFREKTFCASILPAYWDAWMRRRTASVRHFTKAKRVQREIALSALLTRNDLNYLWRRVHRK